MADFIKTYLDYTKEQESPTLFHSWVASTMISAAMKRQTWLDRGGFKALRLYPNVYVMLVGPPGRQKKSTAIRIGMDMLYEADPSVQIFQERMTPEGMMLAMNRISANIQTQSITKDSSLLMVASELTTMFGADQSQAGRMISFMTRWYDCPDIFAYVTAAHGKLEYFNLYPSFLGATPETMLNIIPFEAQGGLLSRMIFIHSEERKRIPRPQAGAGYDVLVDQLKHIANNMRGTFVETQAAQRYFDDWYMTIPDETDAKAATFAERLPDHALKLAMILAASRDTMTIDIGLLDAAIGQMRDMMPGVRRVLHHVGVDDYAELTMRILDQVKEYGPRAKVQIYNFNSFSASVEMIDQAITDLVDRGLIKEVFVGKVPSYIPA